MNTDSESEIPSNDEIEQVIALLGSLPAVTMPDDVTHRLTQVIAAESAARLTVDPQSPASPPSHRSRGRWLFAAAGVAAVGVVGVALVATSGPTSPPPVAAPTASHTEQTAINDTGNFSVQPISSGLSYTAASLAPAVSANMASVPTTAPEPSRRASSFAATSAGVKSCLEGVGASVVDLRMIDLATYENLPSAIMAFRAGDEDRTADVVVVGNLCSRSDPQVRTRAVVVMAR